MASIRDIRKQVMAEFAAQARKPLDRNGKLAAKHIFDMTLKPFHQRGLRQSPPIDVWTRTKFRGFILAETRKIAAEASRGKSGEISARTLNRAAVKVMTKTQKVCRVLIKRGKLDLAIGTVHGEVCDTYLATHT